jgi:hypothetical protein
MKNRIKTVEIKPEKYNIVDRETGEVLELGNGSKVFATKLTGETEYSSTDYSYFDNNKCIDCGKHISKNALRCKVCAGKQTSTRQLGKNNPMYGKLPSHGKHFKYKKCNFRSSWELAYAKYLDKNHIKWEYEPRTFKINNMTYTPDFYLPNSDTWIEIKGYWRDDAIKKFIMIKKLYKSMKIVLLTGKTLKEKGII